MAGQLLTGEQEPGTLDYLGKFETDFLIDRLVSLIALDP